MTSIAEFTLPPSGFPLGRVFEDRPEATLDLDRVVPSGDTVMPYFWVQTSDGGLAAIRELFDGLPELRSAVLMEDLGDKGLFRAEWEPEYLGIMSAIERSGVTVLSATGSNDGWTFELRAGEGEQFSTFRRYCEDQGIPVTLTSLSRITTAERTEHGLTAEQHEALTLAYSEGYYDDSRRTDLEELATHLSITRQALAARLRRGYRNLIASTIIDDR